MQIIIGPILFVLVIGNKYKGLATMGLLLDDKHPVFNRFPTGIHSGNLS